NHCSARNARSDASGFRSARQHQQLSSAPQPIQLRATGFRAPIETSREVAEVKAARYSSLDRVAICSPAKLFGEDVHLSIALLRESLYLCAFGFCFGEMSF